MFKHSFLAGGYWNYSTSLFPKYLKFWLFFTWNWFFLIWQDEKLWFHSISYRHHLPYYHLFQKVIFSCWLFKPFHLVLTLVHKSINKFFIIIFSIYMGNLIFYTWRNILTIISLILSFSFQSKFFHFVLWSISLIIFPLDSALNSIIKNNNSIDSCSRSVLTYYDSWEIVVFIIFSFPV